MYIGVGPGADRRLKAAAKALNRGPDPTPLSTTPLLRLLPTTHRNSQAPHRKLDPAGGCRGTRLSGTKGALTQGLVVLTARPSLPPRRSCSGSARRPKPS
jgi:hypothetical protein